MNKFTKLVVVSGVAIATLSSNAFATATLTAPTFALDDVAVVAGALLVGLAGFWAIKKGIGLAK